MELQYCQLVTIILSQEQRAKLQTSIAKVQRGRVKWPIKRNETKSMHTDFTNKGIEHKPV